MKVYIVIMEDYEYWHIDRVFSKKEDADKLNKHWRDIGWTCNIFEEEVK